MTDHRAIAATLEEAEMRSVEISKTLREMLPNGWNFTLVLARPEKPGQDGIMTYIFPDDLDCTHEQIEPEDQLLMEFACS